MRRSAATGNARPGPERPRASLPTDQDPRLGANVEEDWDVFEGVDHPEAVYEQDGEPYGADPEDDEEFEDDDLDGEDLEDDEEPEYPEHIEDVAWNTLSDEERADTLRHFLEVAPGEAVRGQMFNADYTQGKQSLSTAWSSIANYMAGIGVNLPPSYEQFASLTPAAQMGLLGMAQPSGPAMPPGPALPPGMAPMHGGPWPAQGAGMPGTMQPAPQAPNNGPEDVNDLEGFKAWYRQQHGREAGIGDFTNWVTERATQPLRQTVEQQSEAFVRQSVAGEWEQLRTKFPEAEDATTRAVLDQVFTSRVRQGGYRYGMLEETYLGLFGEQLLQSRGAPPPAPEPPPVPRSRGTGGRAPQRRRAPRTFAEIEAAQLSDRGLLASIESTMEAESNVYEQAARGRGRRRRR